MEQNGRPNGITNKPFIISLIAQNMLEVIPFLLFFFFVLCFHRAMLGSSPVALEVALIEKHKHFVMQNLLRLLLTIAIHCDRGSAFDLHGLKLIPRSLSTSACLTGRPIAFVFCSPNRVWILVLKQFFPKFLYFSASNIFINIFKDKSLIPIDDYNQQLYISSNVFYEWFGPRVQNYVLNQFLFELEALPCC